MNRLQIILVIGLSFFFQQFTNAQTNQNVQFLQKVGALDSIYSKSLNEFRKIYVQLPADYNPNKNKKYPVVYILDGEVLLPTANNVQNFYSGGFMPEMVLSETNFSFNCNPKSKASCNCMEVSSFFSITVDVGVTPTSLEINF